MNASLFDYRGKRIMAMPGRGNRRVIYWGSLPVCTITRLCAHRYQTPDGQIETTLSEAVYNYLQRANQTTTKDGDT
jgi:hypothetical protein